MASWYIPPSSSDESSCSSDDLLPMANNGQEMPTVRPVRCKPEPLSTDASDSENESEDESDEFNNFLQNSRSPHSSLTSGDSPSVRSNDDGSRTSPRRERSPVGRDQPNPSLWAFPAPRRSNYTIIDDCPYFTTDGYINHAVAMADGLSIRHVRGRLFVPYKEIPQNVILTGSAGKPIAYYSSKEGWIEIPKGIEIDHRINNNHPTMTIIPYECLKDGIIPPFPVVTEIPSADGGPSTFRIHSVPPATPIATNVPLAIPIDNVPINIKSEIISDDEDDADNHNMYADVHNDDAAAAAAATATAPATAATAAPAVYNEVHTDAYNDIDTEAFEAKESLVLRSIESNEEPVVERSESNEEPVVERSESNEEPSEEKFIPLAISSSEYFQKEICQKDSSDPTFGDGFEVEKIVNYKVTDDDVCFFEIQWRSKNFSGIDLLKASIIYEHWPDVALKFYQERYPEVKDKKKT